MDGGDAWPELEPPADGWTLRQAAQVLFADKIAAMQLIEFEEAAILHTDLMYKYIDDLPKIMQRQFLHAVRVKNIRIAPDATIASKMIFHDSERYMLIREQYDLQRHFKAILPLLLAAAMLKGYYVATGWNRAAPLDPLVHMAPAAWLRARPLSRLWDEKLSSEDEGAVRLVDGVTLDGVRVHRAPLYLAPAPQPKSLAPTTLIVDDQHAAYSRVVGGIGTEKKLGAWLANVMRAAPDNPTPKSEMRRRAKD
jgi:hypothetical protein